MNTNNAAGEMRIFGTPRAIAELEVMILAARRGETPKPSDRTPFDLEAAKAGAPLVTRNGRKARFVAHVPEAAEEYRVIAMIEGRDHVAGFCENGRVLDGENRLSDLFMAPKPKRTKRTKYANLYVTHLDGHTLNEWRLYDTASYAGDIALTVSATTRAVATAVPVEVEE